MTGLVERDSQLAALRALLEAAQGGEGRVALVSGEAGIGKTSVARALAESRGGARLWWGACDALQTPHPLAPLHDIAREGEPAFAALFEAGASRAALFEAVLAQLRRGPPTLFVVEDAHWADDATLDLVKFIGRRIDRLPVLLAITFRDDEVGPLHPLRQALGELSARSVARVELPRLSPAAVDALARSALRSPSGLHDATGGNPFFVTELLRRGDEALPRSIQDLVLARLARLPQAARGIVQLASIFPARVERDLVQELARPSAADVESCLNSGLLLAQGDFLCFRHELARVAVEGALAAPVAEELHARALGALRAAPAAPVARLVHHAARARDLDAVRELAPRAAEEALARGSHREAAAHYEAALAAGASDDDERARWLEAFALESRAIDRLDAAIAARQQLAELHRRRGDVRRQARNLSELALVLVLALRNAEADRVSREAIALLEPLPESVELAWAYRVEAQLRMLNRDCRESVEWGRKAIALAERFGDRHLLAASLSSVGAANLFLDFDEAVRLLGRALEIAVAEDLHFLAANVHINLGSGAGEVFRLEEAARYLQRGIEFSARHEIDFYRHYALAWLALAEVFLGRWDDAEAHAQEVLGSSKRETTSRIMALAALGRLKVRRGDPDAHAVLADGTALAAMTGTLQRIAPLQAARAELAMREGDGPKAEAEARAVLGLAVAKQHPWFAGELSYWCWRAGSGRPRGAPCAEPFALEMEGRWAEAAQAWAALGCPYEEARALSQGDAAAQSRALAVFERLGAAPAAEALRKRLRASGVRGVPRGAREATRRNPHGLTARELEILGLLCEGLRNSEIAERLFRSVRTVDHHVEAVFAKLGVDSRAEAIAAAHRAGIAPKNRQAHAQK